MIPTARTCRVTLVSKPRASGDDPPAFVGIIMISL